MARSMDFAKSFLIIIMGSDVCAYVPPVDNLSFACSNFQNTLYWNYSHGSLKPKFRIDVVPPPNGTTLWVEYPTLHCDLSLFSDPFIHAYLVSVTAVIGNNESLSIPTDGLTFSYDEHSSTRVRVACSLDLPHVNVNVAQSEVIFSFHHPSMMYLARLTTKPQRIRKNNKELSNFTYRVVITDQGGEKQTHRNTCVQPMCKQTVGLTEGWENLCLRITGRWEDVVVRTVQDYCAKAPAKTSNLPILIVLIVLVIVLFVGLMLMYLLKKFHVLSALPKALIFSKPDYSNTSQLPLTPEQDNAAVASLSGLSFLLYPEEECWSPTGAAAEEPDHRLPIGGDRGSCGEEEEEGLYLCQLDESVNEDGEAAASSRDPSDRTPVGAAAEEPDHRLPVGGDRGSCGPGGSPAEEQGLYLFRGSQLDESVKEGGEAAASSRNPYEQRDRIVAFAEGENINTYRS